MAFEEIACLVALDAKMKKIKPELKAAVLERGTSLLIDILGVGPAGAARTLADVGDVARFAGRNRYTTNSGPNYTTSQDATSARRAERDPGLGPGEWLAMNRQCLRTHRRPSLRHHPSPPETSRRTQAELVIWAGLTLMGTLTALLLFLGMARGPRRAVAH